MRFFVRNVNTRVVTLVGKEKKKEKKKRRRRRRRREEEVSSLGKGVLGGKPFLEWNRNYLKIISPHSQDVATCSTFDCPSATPYTCNLSQDVARCSKTATSYLPVDKLK